MEREEREEDEKWFYKFQWANTVNNILCNSYCEGTFKTVFTEDVRALTTLFVDL